MKSRGLRDPPNDRGRDVEHVAARFPRASRDARSAVGARIARMRAPFHPVTRVKGAHRIATPFVRLLVAGGQNALDGLR